MSDPTGEAITRFVQLQVGAHKAAEARATEAALLTGWGVLVTGPCVAAPDPSVPFGTLRYADGWLYR